MAAISGSENDKTTINANQVKSISTRPSIQAPANQIDKQVNKLHYL